MVVLVEVAGEGGAFSSSPKRRFLVKDAPKDPLKDPRTLDVRLPRSVCGLALVVFEGSGMISEVVDWAADALVEECGVTSEDWS